MRQASSTVTAADQTPKAHAFVTLDGLRGLAAAAVVLFHTPELFGGALFPGGYLAVDFFFTLSGFVLAFAYQTRLDKGLPTGQFLRVRIARLYPLYLLSLLIGISGAFVQGAFRFQTSGAIMLTAAFLGFFLLPVAGTPTGYIFPYNQPAWSVFFELVANGLHAVFYRGASTRRLVFGWLIAFLCLLLAVHRLGDLNFGAYSESAAWAIFRVFGSYTLGMLAYRMWQSRRMPQLPAILPAACLLIILAVRVPNSVRGVYDLFSATCLFPLLTLVAASSEPPQRLRKPFLSLGAASYAVYVLQYPFVRVFTRVWTSVAHQPPQRSAPWSGLLLLMLLLTAAHAADAIYDLPARARLRTWLLPKRAA